MITVNAQFTGMNIALPTPRLAGPVLAYMICIILPIRVMAGPLQLTTLRLYMLAMLVPLFIHLARSRRFRPTGPDICLTLFVLWVGVAMSVNTPAQAVEHTGITTLELLGGYFLARICILNPGQFYALTKTLTLLIMLCLPLAVFETVTGRPPLIELIRAIPALSSVEIVSIAPRLGLERVQGVFAHPIHFGLFCSTAVSLLFLGLSQHLSLGIRLAGLACITITAFFALSSGAFLSVLIQLFLISWATIFAGLKRKWLVLLAACAVAYVFVDLVSNRSPMRVFFSYATFSAHNAYWRSLIFEWGMVNVWNNPIFGLGLNDWVRPHFMYSGSMDNFWLAGAVRYGIPGFLLLAAGWGWGLIRVARSLTPYPHLKAAWLICIIGLSFTLATVHVWTAVYSFVFFLFGAGQWLAAPVTRPTAPTDLTFTRPFTSGFSRMVPRP
jgi:hypothetical protein